MTINLAGRDAINRRFVDNKSRANPKAGITQADLDAQVKAFKRGGGVITHIPNGVTGEDLVSLKRMQLHNSKDFKNRLYKMGLYNEPNRKMKNETF
tara:strand:+ start:863 stop:1150 length:288 start_codon:yes stop_codon:yes gene_type:complete